MTVALLFENYFYFILSEKESNRVMNKTLAGTQAIFCFLFYFTQGLLFYSSCNFWGLVLNIIINILWTFHRGVIISWVFNIITFSLVLDCPLLKFLLEGDLKKFHFKSAILSAAMRSKYICTSTVLKYNFKVLVLDLSSIICYLPHQISEVNMVLFIPLHWFDSSILLGYFIKSSSSPFTNLK